MHTSRRKMIVSGALAAASGMASETPKTSPKVKKRVIYPDGKPQLAETPVYSEVVVHGDTIYISGHGVNSSSDIKQQTTAVLDRIEKCLESSGSSMGNALKCNVYLRHLEDFAAMNEAYRGRFGPEPPVRTTVAIAGVPLEGCLVEIELIAAL